MTFPIKIIDINGNEREVKNITKVEHARYSSLDGEDYKEVDNVPYVEVIIIGKSGREWVEWYSLEEFKKRNLKVKF
jgi:hypothetical protein